MLNKLIYAQEVTEEEIYAWLCAMGDDKAPGIDGYNAVFFKKSWPIIKNEICGALSAFFNNGLLYLDINCTTITLLPKKVNPETIKDYRPIVCCTMLYKLIAKILALRMQKVMNSVISEAQAGFIPGRISS